MAQYLIKTTEDGKSHGPVSSRQLKNLAGAGKLLPTHLISPDAGNTWHQASRFTGLEFASSLPENDAAEDPAPDTGPRLTKEIAEQFLADEDSVFLDEFTSIDLAAAEVLS